MIAAYNGEVRALFFLSCMKVPFDKGTLSLDHWYCKSFPLDMGFCDSEVPLRTGFTVIRQISTYSGCMCLSAV
jgi:hypothetical protein